MYCSSSGNGVISGTPSAAGNYTIDATVQDSRGASANTTFAWTVLPAPTQLQSYGGSYYGKTSMRDVFVGTLAAAAQATGTKLIMDLTQAVAGGLTNWFSRYVLFRSAQRCRKLFHDPYSMILIK